MSAELFNNPANLESWRQRLFDIPRNTEPLEITLEEYSTYFPYVDNVWTFDNKRTNKKAQVSYYDCRLFKRRPSSSRSTELPPEAKRRKTKAREPGQCKVKIKIEEYAPGAAGEYPNGIVRISRITDEEHRHGLDESDKLKRNSVVRGIARAQMEKGQQPAEVLALMKGVKSMEGSTRLDAAGGKYLTRQDVINAGMAKGLAKADAKKEPVRKAFRETLAEACEFLRSKGWICEYVRGKENEEEVVLGIVFGEKDRLHHLLRRGFLTLLDSAESLSVPAPGALYTFMVRSSTGEYVPGAHAILDTYAVSLPGALTTAIRTLQSWAKFPWKVRYLLTRESSLFREVIETAFPPPGADFVTSHLLCTHSSETALHNSLASVPDAREKMFAAMYQRRTREDVLSTVDAAMADCADVRLRRILKEWRDNIDKWALFARNEAAVLLQIRDLSPLDEFHSRVGTTAKQVASAASMNASHSHSLASSMTMSMTSSMLPPPPPAPIPQQQKGLTTLLSALTLTPLPTAVPPQSPPPLPPRQLSLVLPLQSFPPFLHPLLISTLTQALHSIRNGEPQYLTGASSCNCLYTRAWRLPCRHLLAAEYVRGPGVVRWREIGGGFEGWSGWEGWEGVEAGTGEWGLEQVQVGGGENGVGLGGAVGGVGVGVGVGTGGAGGGVGDVGMSMSGMIG